MAPALSARFRLATSLLCVGLLVLTGLAGCQRQSASLVDLLGVSPRTVDRGDRLELLGRNLPTGKRARVLLEGVVFRPGAPPRARFLAETEAITQPDRAVATITEELHRRLLGEGISARHATFRGSVTLSFEPLQASAPEVVGTLGEVVLDVEGATPSAQENADALRESARFLGHAGMTLESEQPPFRITEVKQNGLAHTAGLKPGDVLIEVDSVNLLSYTDFAPRTDQTRSELLFRRGHNPTAQSVLLPTAAFHHQPPSLIAATAIGLVALALALVVCFWTPLGRGLRWLGAQLAWRLKEGFFRHNSDSRKPRARHTKPLGWALRGLLSLAILSAFSWLLRSSAGEQASSILYAVVVGLLLLTALVAGGRVARGNWSLGAALRSSLFALTHVGLTFAALAHVALLNGTFDVARVAGAQGAEVWRWNALASPLSLVAWGLYCVCLIPSYAPPLTPLPQAHLRADPKLPSVLDWFLLTVFCALGVVFFLGGWQEPKSTGLRPTLAAEALTMFGFWTKSLLLFAAAVLVRVVVRSASVSDFGLWLWKWTVPVAASLLLLTPSLLRLSVPPFAADLARVALLVFSVLVGLFLALQVSVAWRSQRPELGIHPWV